MDWILAVHMTTGQPWVFDEKPRALCLLNLVSYHYCIGCFKLASWENKHRPKGIKQYGQDIDRQAAKDNYDKNLGFAFDFDFGVAREDEGDGFVTDENEVRATTRGSTWKDEQRWGGGLQGGQPGLR